ncbi:imidazole glycerol phosphate synthase subunit HisH [bacterium]|nr:imidazole glycerol phosphate synthase subunit HisH [bacterium]
MKVVIVDYGMGNIRSITGALKYLGVGSVSVSNKSLEIKSADKLILPGIGSFSVAMSNIKRLEIDKYLVEEVLKKKKPILGICLGMQLMCKSSTEDSYSHGLGFIKGVVSEFSESSLKIPHIGFNQVKVNNDSRLFKGINNLSDFYFVHSFRMADNINISHSTCIYNDEFIASYEQDNIAGVQFHPELSQTNGLKLLKNFIEYF